MKVHLSLLMILIKLQFDKAGFWQMNIEYKISGVHTYSCQKG